MFWTGLQNTKLKSQIKRRTVIWSSTCAPVDFSSSNNRNSHQSNVSSTSNFGHILKEIHGQDLCRKIWYRKSPLQSKCSSDWTMNYRAARNNKFMYGSMLMWLALVSCCLSHSGCGRVNSSTAITTRRRGSNFCTAPNNKSHQGWPQGSLPKWANKLWLWLTYIHFQISGSGELLGVLWIRHYNHHPFTSQSQAHLPWWMGGRVSTATAIGNSVAVRVLMCTCLVCLERVPGFNKK